MARTQMTVKVLKTMTSGNVRGMIVRAMHPDGPEAKFELSRSTRCGVEATMGDQTGTSVMTIRDNETVTIDDEDNVQSGD